MVNGNSTTSFSILGQDDFKINSSANTDTGQKLIGEAYYNFNTTFQGVASPGKTIQLAEYLQGQLQVNGVKVMRLDEVDIQNPQNADIAMEMAKQRGEVVISLRKNGSVDVNLPYTNAGADRVSDIVDGAMDKITPADIKFTLRNQAPAQQIAVAPAIPVAAVQAYDPTDASRDGVGIPTNIPGNMVAKLDKNYATPGDFAAGDATVFVKLQAFGADISADRLPNVVNSLQNKLGGDFSVAMLEADPLRQRFSPEVRIDLPTNGNVSFDEALASTRQALNSLSGQDVGVNVAARSANQPGVGSGMGGR